MNDDMTQAELAVFLETLADLVEAKSSTPEEAAKLLRDKAKGLK